MRQCVKPIRAGKDRGAGLCLGGAILGVSVLLAGCAEEKPAPPPGPFGQYINSAPRKITRPATRQPGQAKATSPETTPGEGAPEASAAGPEQPSQSQPGPAATPPEQTALAVPSSTDLLGLDPQHTRELLGPAAQTNKQSPATVWHYKGDRCELDLSFYMEMRSGQMRTLHYNFKGEADSPEQRQACLRSIIEENRKPEHS